jgi:hypothetical protein
MSYANELIEKQKELAKVKIELDKKNAEPKTRQAQFVTVKTISEIFPDFKVTEASLILGDRKYRMTFQIDDYIYDSDFAEKSYEVIYFKGEYVTLDVNTSPVLNPSIAMRETTTLPREWTKDLTTKTLKIPVDLKPLKEKIKRLEARIAELPPLIEEERIKEEKEFEERKKEEELEMRWWKYSRKMLERLNEDMSEEEDWDFSEKNVYIQDVMNREYDIWKLKEELKKKRQH